ncbi:hypothetical protein C5S29_02435, partial [ANME-1 cluster archaeon GoMg3.2]|nr:hypothetical protein [ANME-1 cluster archaeon GoMg3.2]
MDFLSQKHIFAWIGRKFTMPSSWSCEPTDSVVILS